MPISDTPQGSMLIVDDIEENRLLLMQLFEGSGYRLYQAGNGMEAVWMAVAHQPDLILLDVRMPVMNGLEACRCLKQYPATASIPIIIISAADSPQDRLAGFEAGAVDYIGKPFDEAEVLTRAATHIQTGLVYKDIVKRRHASILVPDGEGDGAPFRSRSREVLVVEGSPEAMQLLVERLRTSGHSAREAPTGELALWSASKHPPDLIMLDMEMPDMSGLALCRAFKKDPVLASIPVIFLTAHADEATRALGFAAGGIDFIGRPFDVDRLLVRIEAHLQWLDRLDKAAAMPGKPCSDRGCRFALEEAFSLCSTGVLFLKTSGEIDFVNPAFICLSGFALDEMVGRHFSHMLVAVDEWARLQLPAQRPESGLWQYENAFVRTRVGTEIPCWFGIASIRDAQGQDWYLVAVVEAYKAENDGISQLVAASEYAAFGLDDTLIQGLDGSLSGAVERGEFHLLYQPIFRLSDMRLVGAEALLRWHHPSYGLLQPYRFLQILEATGEILVVGHWVLDEACRQLAAWMDGALPEDFRVAVNIGSLEFWQETLVADIAQALQHHGLPAQRLMLEISAETLCEDLDQAIERLGHLKALGVTLALDRYSQDILPLERLARLPVDIFKSMPSPGLDSASQLPGRGLITQAHGLKRQVILGGVEQPGHLELVQSCGPEMVQGYVLGHPVSADEFQREYFYG